MLLTVAVLSLGLLCVIFFILWNASLRKLKRENIRLHERLETVAILLDALPVYTYALDLRSGRFTACNKGCGTLLNCPRENIIGKTPKQIFKTSHAESFIHHEMTCEPGQTLVRNITVEKADGSILYGVSYVRTILLGNQTPVLVGAMVDVTEARENEMHLSSLTALFKDILEQIPGHLYVRDYDNENRFLFVSGKLCEDYAYTRNALENRKLADCFPPDTVSDTILSDLETIRLKIPNARQETLRFADGKDHTLYTVKKLHEHDGKRLLIGVSIDLTSQLENEKRLLKQLENQKQVNTLVSAIWGDTDLESSFYTLLKYLCEFWNADSTILLRFDSPEKNHIITTQTYSIPGLPVPEVLNTVCLPTDPWINHLTQHGIVRLPNTCTPDARKLLGSSAERARLNNTQAFFAVGIFDGKDLWGVLAVTAQSAGKLSGKAPELETLTTLADVSSLILRRDRILSRRKRAENEKLLLSDALPMPVFLYAADGRLLRCNPAAVALIGKDESDIYGSPYDCNRYLCGLRQEDGLCPVRRTIADGKPHELRIVRQGVPCLVNSYPIRGEGNHFYVLKTIVPDPDAGA